MILFSITRTCEKWRPFEKTLFYRECGAPVRRTGVVSFDLYIPLNELSVDSEEKILEYLNLLKQCYVYCDYRGIKELDLTEKGLNELIGFHESNDMNFLYDDYFERPNPLRQKYHHFEFNIKDIYSKLKFDEETIELLSKRNMRLYNLYLLTCVRYLNKNYGFDIVNRTLELSKTFPKWEKIKCLQLAHYPFHPEYNSHYSLLEENVISSIITKKQLLDELKKTDRSLNTIFSKNILDLENTDIKKIRKIYDSLSKDIKNYLTLKRYLESPTLQDDFITHYEYEDYVLYADEDNVYDKFFKQ